MGQLLTGMDIPSDIKENGDFLGGFSALESGVYDATVELAYMSVADSGAKAVNILLKTSDGRQMRQQFWITSGTAKGGLPYYVNQKTLEKKFLPGFEMAQHLCLLTIGKAINTLETEEKVINLYSSAEGKELPTKVDMLVDLLGKPITAGVIKQIVDKNKKNDQTGVYEPTGEVRTENEVDKFFRTRDGMTVTEIKAKATEAKFKTQWSDKWDGQIRDKSSKTAGVHGTSGAPSKPGKPANNTADTLFA